MCARTTRTRDCPLTAPPPTTKSSTSLVFRHDLNTILTSVSTRRSADTVLLADGKKSFFISDGDFVSG